MKFQSSMKKLMFVLVGFSLLSSITPFSSSFASLEFDPEINLSSSAGNSEQVQIAVDGNIYVVWWENGSDIFFKRSLDNGASFESSINLSNSISTSRFPQIAAAGNNVSVVWTEDNEIKIATSSNSGLSFGSPQNLSNNAGTSTSPQIAMSGSNIFVVWEDKTDGDKDILFTNSTGPGNPFGTPINLSSSQTLSSINSQISADGSDVFVVWSDDTPNGFSNTADVLLSSSSSTGASFGSENNLSLTAFNSKNPQISVSGNNVHVVWSEVIPGSSQINIKSSTDNGASFGSTKNLSNTDSFSENPQLSAFGNNIHVVWEDDIEGNTDIFYVNSANSGTTFGDIINLSENDGLSTEPQISTSGSEIHVVWKDESFGTDSDSNILLRSSSDNGSNFASFQKVSDNTGISNEPQIVSSGNEVFVVWTDNSVGNKEIFFRTANVSSNVINFDSSQYNIGQSPIITVTDLSSINLNHNETKSATVTSDSDSVGITLDLTEDADTGIFTNLTPFTLTNDSSSNASKTLHAEVNDAITVTVETATGSASIRPTGIVFDFTEYGYGDIAHITVTDESANTNDSTIQNVTVNITSDLDSTGISLTLFETETDSGIFSGNPTTSNVNSDLIFMIGDTRVTLDDTLSFCLPFPGRNTNSSEIDEITDIHLESSSDKAGIDIKLIETGPDTGVFERVISFDTISSDSDSAKLLATEGDFFLIDMPFADFPTRGMIVPQSGEPTDPSRGAITTSDYSSEPQCSIEDRDILREPKLATVSASYQSSNASAEVFDNDAGGGGGGGLVRPSLVVNALAGFGGGGSAYSSPTLQLGNLVLLGQIDVPLEVEQMILNHDSSTPVPSMDLNYFEDFYYPLTINDKGYVLSGYSTTLETHTLEINTPHTIKFLFYESDIIQHFSLYLNLMGANTEIHQSDTQILFNNGLGTEVIDPNGFFENVSLTVNEIDDLKKEVVLEITFANTMDTTDMIVRSWDSFLNSYDTYILDAITVVSDEFIESPITTYEEPIIEELKSQTIPIWIKNNAAWWSDQQISDDDFVKGIEYLIKQGIITVPGVEVGKTSPTDIPDWIQNNAGWWSESLITDDEFIEAMQWLISNGVIQI